MVDTEELRLFVVDVDLEYSEVGWPYLKDQFFYYQSALNQDEARSLFDAGFPDIMHSNHMAGSYEVKSIKEVTLPGFKITLEKITES